MDLKSSPFKIRSLYLCAILFAFIALCNSKSVNQFHFATWNSRGAKWGTVLDIMNQGNLDVLAVQEAGALPDEVSPRIGKVKPTDKLLDQDYINHNPGDKGPYLSVFEYEWTVGTQLFYIYQYDRTKSGLLVESCVNPSTAYNTAIVTRSRADRLFLMPIVDKNGNLITENHDRFCINRPVTGIRLDDAVFFNFHAQPSDAANEAPGVLKILPKWMAQRYSSETWVLMGDFNRLPNSIKFPIKPPNTFIQLLSSGINTHKRELDFAFWGGPNFLHVNMPKPTLLAITPSNGHSMSSISDHTPVKFN